MTTSTEALAQELVVVTGASTGMGAATTRELAQRGFHVLAGVRRESDGAALVGPNIEPIILDITRSEQIADLARRVQMDPAGRRLRILVNNAGIAVNSPVEALPMDHWRRQFDVNLFGHIEVTQALLPALLLSTGRVVNISSVGGKIAMATYGAYSGTKFALEAVSDALRRELAPFGVQVVIVEPGGVRTEMSGRGIIAAHQLLDAMTPPQRARYGDLVHAITTQSATFTSSGLPAAKAALVIARAATTPRPRTRYTIGRDAAMLTRLSRMLSDRALDRILAANLRPHFPKSDSR